MGIDYFALPFTTDTPDRVVEHMDEMLRLGDGKRWINFRPDLPAEVMALADRKPSVFSGRGPRVPTGTWVPSAVTRSGERVPTQAGIAHPRRHEAAERLAAEGVEVPKGWVVEQDHPKRGMTFLVPDGDDNLVAIGFLTSACGVLSGVVTDDKWVAVIGVR